jgi:DNA-binding response OmpR family regulator
MAYEEILMQTPKPRILVVGDGDFARPNAILDHSIYEVKTAKTLDQGLKVAQSEPFSLYLLHMSLPNGTGADLSLQIRTFDLETPILFLTNGIEEADWQRAKNAGAQGYLIMPGGIDDLGTTVARLLKAHRSSKQQGDGHLT